MSLLPAFEDKESRKLKITYRQQFVTSAGFGNCVVVSQGAAAKREMVAVCRYRSCIPCEKDANQRRNIQGSRAARSLLAELEARGEEAVSVVKRGVTSWIWA